MTTVPLTVLVSDGPMARAYLARMRRANLRPAAVLLMIYSRYPATRKPVAGWMPQALRRWYAARYQDISLNYWPRRLRKAHPLLFESMAETLGQLVDDPRGLLDEILGRFRYDGYADTVTPVLTDGLRDKALADALAKTSSPTVLFTGGGIIPPSLLSMPGLRFVHIHPGHLPGVRGADGILWSTLVRGAPSASCFYMVEKIDTGPVFAVQDFPALTFEVPRGSRPDDTALYRALFSYYDPLLRAEMLAKVLGEHNDLANVPSGVQDTSLGVTYHFMQQALRNAALSRIFVSP